MRNKRFSHSVALGPSINQAGTNLRSAHAVSMSHVMSGGNQVQVPSAEFTYSGLGAKRAVAIGIVEKPPKEKLSEAWQQEAASSASKVAESSKEDKRVFAKLEEWLNKSSKELKATSAYLLECQVEVNSQLFKAHYRNVVKDRAEIL